MEPQPAPAIHQTIDHLFRHESGKMIAVLTRLLGLGQLTTAEDIAQDTLLQALHTWKFSGIPENPAAWIMRVARNRAIDHLRHQKVWERNNPYYARQLASEYTLAPTVNQIFTEKEMEDSMLRMIFACCHPELPHTAQVALILKTLCGLHPREIARAFLTQEDTINKRIYRALEKLREQDKEPEVPLGTALTERLDTVLESLYLLFNEGYLSEQPEQFIREELCAEAMRLTLILTRNNYTSTPATHALLALFCFQASRFEARHTEQGSILLLEDQDRNKWNQQLIQTGNYYLHQVTGGDTLSRYHLEASIAALHASAADFASTRWDLIQALYRKRYELKPSPVIALQWAIAEGYALGPGAALDRLHSIANLQQYHLYPATLAHFYSLNGENEKAIAAYEQAIALTRSPFEKELLERKKEKVRLES